MNWKDVRVEQRVTWGSGEIRGCIKQRDPRDFTCTVVLIDDYKTPCGAVIPQGTSCRMPAAELRLLQ